MHGKKSVLIVINSLELGGAQKSLVSFLKCLNQSTEAEWYDIDLLVAKPCGMFYQDLPENTRLVKPPAELVWLGTRSGDALLKEHPSVGGRIGKLKWKLSLKQRPFHGSLNEEQRLWLNWRGIVHENPKKYDIAVSYMNGFPGYYVIDKVSAKWKVLWIHTEYEKLHYDRGFDAPFYEACSEIITISDACRDSFLRVFPEHRDKIHVLQNITLASDILARGDAGDAPEFEGAELRILSMGRLHEAKQFNLAIGAAAQLKRQGVRFRWLVVGEGEERQALQNQIDAEGLREDFLLVGLRENPYPYLNRCDLFVQTSLYEGKSIAVEEAKIFGKPIISTDYPTVYDNLRDGETGLIVPMKAEAIAAAVSRVLQDPGLKERLAANLRAEPQGNEAELTNYLRYQMGEQID